MSTPQLSVCIASFNGALYIQDQIDSILDDIGTDDEVIVYDDCSTDTTRKLLNAQNDLRLRVILGNKNVGHVRAFEAAVRASQGDYIALADQDDLWPVGRTQLLMNALKDADIAFGNYRTFGAHDSLSPHPFRRQEPKSQSLLNLTSLAIGRLPYFGSAMMMRRELVAAALPFPPWVEAHDQWLGVVGNTAGRVAAHIPDIVTLRRLHSTNLTPQRRRTWGKVVRTRYLMLRMVLEGSRRRSTRNT